MVRCPLSVTIRLSQKGNHVHLVPQGYLGDRFAAFRLAIEGARYDRDLKVNRAPLDKVPGILIRLREADFEAEIDKDLHTTLQQQTAQQWLSLKGVQERIAVVGREIFQKTGKSLFEFQKTGSQWLTMKHAGLLADDPGCGKEQPVSEPVLRSWRRVSYGAMGSAGSFRSPTRSTSRAKRVRGLDLRTICPCTPIFWVRCSQTDAS